MRRGSRLLAMRPVAISRERAWELFEGNRMEEWQRRLLLRAPL